MSELVRYDAMCNAIQACHEVDEVAQIKSQARALEVYAQQVKNTDAERKACEIRIRAERKFGELLALLARASGQRNDLTSSHGGTRLEIPPPSPYAEALTRTGVSRQSAHRYQQLALVPADEFEQAMHSPEKPNTRSVAQLARDCEPEVQKLDEDCLALWGQMKAFERAKLRASDFANLLGLMTQTMRADVRRIVPAMADFYGAALEELNNE